MYRCSVILVLFVCLTATAQVKEHRVRVYNDSKLELRIVITHPATGDSWRVGVLDPGKSSDIQLLRAGGRKLYVYDAITGKELLTQEFTLDGGRRIKLVGETSKDLKVAFPVPTPGEDL